MDDDFADLREWAGVKTRAQDDDFADIRNWIEEFKADNRESQAKGFAESIGVKRADNLPDYNEDNPAAPYLKPQVVAVSPQEFDEQRRAMSEQEAQKKFIKSTTPFAAPIMGVIEAKQVSNAKARVEAGEGTPADAALIQRYQQEKEAEANQSLGQRAIGLVASAPAMIGEFAVGGGITSAIGRGLGVKAATSMLGKIGQAAAGGAARVPFVPSLYAEHASSENIAAGRDAFDPEGFVATLPKAMAQMGTLGALGSVVHPVIRGSGLLPAAKRVAAQGALGAPMQQAVDAVTSVIGMEDGYGVLGKLIDQYRKGEDLDFKSAAEKAAMDALMFTVFAAGHEITKGGEGLPKRDKVAERLKAQLDKIADQSRKAEMYASNQESLPVKPGEPLTTQEAERPAPKVEAPEGPTIVPGLAEPIVEQKSAAPAEVAQEFTIGDAKARNETWAKASQEGGVYVDMDVDNMAGLVKAVGPEAAKKHTRAMAEIVREELNKVGKADLFNQSSHPESDELSAVVTASDQVKVREALSKAEARIKEMVKAEGLDKVERDQGKKAGPAEPGLSFGIEAGQKGVDPRRAFTEAEMGTESSKARKAEAAAPSGAESTAPPGAVDISQTAPPPDTQAPTVTLTRPPITGLRLRPTPPRATVTGGIVFPKKAPAPEPAPEVAPPEPKAPEFTVAELREQLVQARERLKEASQAELKASQKRVSAGMSGTVEETRARRAAQAEVKRLEEIVGKDSVPQTSDKPTEAKAEGPAEPVERRTGIRRLDAGKRQPDGSPEPGSQLDRLNKLIEATPGLAEKLDAITDPVERNEIERLLVSDKQSKAGNREAQAFDLPEAVERELGDIPVPAAHRHAVAQFLRRRALTDIALDPEIGNNPNTGKPYSGVAIGKWVKKFRAEYGDKFIEWQNRIADANEATGGEETATRTKEITPEEAAAAKEQGRYTGLGERRAAPTVEEIQSNPELRKHWTQEVEDEAALDELVSQVEKEYGNVKRQIREAGGTDADIEAALREADRLASTQVATDGTPAVPQAAKLGDPREALRARRAARGGVGTPPATAAELPKPVSDAIDKQNPRLSPMKDAVVGFLKDEAGFIDIADAAATMKAKINEASAQILQLAGKMFPRTARVDQTASDLMVRMAKAGHWGEEAGPYYGDIVSGDNATDAFRVRVGAVATELHLRNTRDFYQQRVQETSAALNDALIAKDAATEAMKQAKEYGDQDAMNQAKADLRIASRAAARASRANYKARILQRKVTSVVGMDNSPFQTEEAFQAASTDPEVTAALERYKQHVAPIVRSMYMDTQGFSTPEEIPDSPQIRGFEMNLRIPEEGEVSPTVASRQGNIRNVKQKANMFARQRTGAAEAYDLDINKIIANSFAKTASKAAHAALNRHLVANELAEFGGPGESHGDKIYVPFVNPPKGTMEGVPKVRGREPREVGLYVDPRLAHEYRQTIALPKTAIEKPFALTNAINVATLQSIAEPVGHGANLLTGLLNPHVLTKLPNAITEGLKNTPEFRKKLLDLVQIGAQKRPGSESGFISTGLRRMGASLPEWADKADPSYWASVALHKVNDIVRFARNEAFTALAKKGYYQDTEANRRDFINSGAGQYEKSAQHGIIRLARESGVGPFATAASQFSVQGVLQGLLGSPGAKTTGLGSSALLRFQNLMTGAIGGLALTSAINYALWKRADGDDNTPFGSIKYGVNEDGKTISQAIPLVWPMLRGLRTLGLMALIEGGRKGESFGQTADKAMSQIGHGLLHPVMGPAGQFAHTAITGKNSLGLNVTESHGRKVRENIGAALLNANPTVGQLAGSNMPPDMHRSKTEAFLGMFGKFAPQFRGGPNKSERALDDKAKEMFGQKYTSLGLKKQADVTKAMKVYGEKPEADPDLIALAAKSSQERAHKLQSNLSQEAQDRLSALKHRVPPHDNKITYRQEQVQLTRDQLARYEELLRDEYDREIRKWNISHVNSLKPSVRQEYLKRHLKEAQERVTSKLIKEFK